MDLKTLILLAFGLVTLLFGSCLWRAKSVPEQFYGVVTDSTGASVPNVNVTATNEDTRFSRSTVRSTDGSYISLLLP